MVKNKKASEIKWKKWVIATCCFLPLLTLIFASSNTESSLLSSNNLTNTNNDMLSKDARVANSESLTNSLSDVKPLTNNSRKFKEIYIANSIDSQEKLFSLVYENDNLYFRTSQDNDLLHSARLSKNKGMDINNSNAVNFGSNVLSIDKITIDEKGQTSSKAIVIDTNDKNLPASPTFLLSDSGNYFAAGDEHNMDLGFTSKDTFLVRFYLDKLLSTNTLSLFYDDGVNVIGSNSDEQLKSSINMLSSNSSIAIEGYISKTASGVSFSFGQVQSVGNAMLNSVQGTVNDRIFESFKNERVNEVLKKVALGNPDDLEDDTLTWTNYFKPLRLNGFSDSQIIFSSFQIAAEPAQGKISINLSIPIMNWISTPTIGMQHFVYANDNDKQQFEITGFNTGSVLLRSIFDSPIKKIPELVLTDSENSLKQIIFEQGFGPDNLLDNFDFNTDMNLEYITVDNLNGTINANLNILRNYRDADGNPITGDISKDFGEIQILKFSTIVATSQIDEQYILNPDSPYVSILASEAAKDLDGLKNLIFDNHDSFLDNLPNDVTTSKNVTINDFEIYDAIGNDIKGTIDLQIGLKYYFNKTLGHYQNSEPFKFNLSILGFDKIKLETTINTNPTQQPFPQDLKNILAQNITDLTNPTFKKFLFDAVIEGGKQEISSDNITNIEIESYDNLNGILVLSSITLDKWYDANNDIQDFGKKFDAIITIPGFKQSVPTVLTGTIFDYKDMLQDKLASEISDDYLRQLLDLKYSDMLIVENLPEGFTSHNIVNPIILNRNDKYGTLEIAFYLNNYYATNGQLITTSNKVFGPITITGFKETDYETKINENPTETDDLKDILAQTVDLNNETFKDYLIKYVIIDPSKEITINNIVSINIKTNSINNLTGTLVLDSITLNKWYDDRSVAQDIKREFKANITISGFKVIVATSIYKDVIIDGQLSDTIASSVTNEQLKQIIYDRRDMIFENSNKSLPEIGLDNLFISARDSPRPDALTIRFELDSFYDEQGKLITTKKKEFGPITIEGFKKTGLGTHLVQTNENDSIELNIYPYQTTTNPTLEITTKIKQYIFDNVIYSKKGLDVNCISRFSIAKSPFDNKNGILLIDSITLNTWVEDDGSINNTGFRNFALDNGEQIKIWGFNKVAGETVIKNNLNNPVVVDGELSKLTVSHLIQNANNPLLLEWINSNKSSIFLNLTPNVIITVQKIVENECDITIGKLVLEVQLSSYFDNDDFYTYKEATDKTFKISLEFEPELNLETKINEEEIVLPKAFAKTLAQSISEKNASKEIVDFKAELIKKIITGKKDLIDIVDFTSTFDNLKGMLILDSITLNHVYDKNGVLTNEKNKLFSNLKINVRGFLVTVKTELQGDKKLDVTSAGNFWQDEFAIKLQELINKNDSTIIRSLQELIWNNQSILFDSMGIPLNFSSKNIIEFTTTNINYNDQEYNTLRDGKLRICFKLDTYYNGDGKLVKEGRSEVFEITLENLRKDEKSTNMKFGEIGLDNYKHKLPYLVSKEEIMDLIYRYRLTKQNNNAITKKIEIENFEYSADNMHGQIIVTNIKLNSIIDCEGKQITNNEEGWDFGSQKLIFKNLDSASGFTDNVKEIRVSGDLTNYEAGVVSNNQILDWLNDKKDSIFKSLPPDSVVTKVEKKDATSEGTSTVEVTLSSIYLNDDCYTYSTSPNKTKFSIILSGFKKENVMQIIPIAIGGAAAVVIAIIVIIVIVYFHRKKKSGKVHVVYEEDL